MEGADIVFTYSYVSWQAAAERGWFMPEDRLAKALVFHERVGRLIVSDLMRSLPAMLLREAVAAAGGSRFPFPSSPSRQHMRPVRLRREYPTSIAQVRRACAAYDRALERRAADGHARARPDHRQSADGRLRRVRLGGARHVLRP